MSLRSLATSALLLSSPVVAASANQDETADLLMGRMEEMLERRLAEQRAVYEQRLLEQKEAHETQISQMVNTVAEVSELVNPTNPEELRRRFLASTVPDLDDYSGLNIKKSKAGISFGPDGDVRVLRTGLGQMMLVADVNVTGSLFVDMGDIDVAEAIKDSASRLDSLETMPSYEPIRLTKAALDFGASWSYDYDTAKVPYGADAPTYVFDYPQHTALGYGHMISGKFTAPVDGLYFISTKLRVKDGSSSSMEIEFVVDGADTEGFEMWLSEGDASGRRACMSAYLGFLRAGESLYPMSDLTTASGVMGQTEVIQIASDRIAFSAVASGTTSSAQSPFGSVYTETVRFVTPTAYTSYYEDGVFTAPRAGIYYVFCKMRIKDATTGDTEIEWAKNGNEVDGSFEMWLHTGDPSARRTHISAMLIDLDEGDTVYPFTDLVLSASSFVTFSGFELPDDLPAFNVETTESYTYSSSSVAFGADASTKVTFERGSTDAYADGVYTVPEDGFYYFTQKLRTGDNDSPDIEIEWMKNGADASTNNFEMWLHTGDSSGRRSGMSSTLLQCKKGDEIYAHSDLSLTTSDVVATWTFSGFKVQ